MGCPGPIYIQRKREQNMQRNHMQYDYQCHQSEVLVAALFSIKIARRMDV